MASKFNSQPRKKLTKNESLAIFIPMFNEQETAEVCIDKVLTSLRQLSCKSKLFIVDDGSNDNTASILSKKKKQYKNTLAIVTHKRNKGYGAATQTGIREAEKQNFTWILHMDSDLTNDPKYIKSFWESRDENTDCIKASRYIPGGRVKNVPNFRRVISFVGNSLAKFMFGLGINDCTNGFRMVRLSKLSKIKFKENNFSIILEELYYLKKKKARFKEIPYTLTARSASTSHFRYRPKIFYDYFKYALKSFFV